MSDDHGLEAARSQFGKIAGLVLALQSADVFAREDAEERITEDALEVMIRSSWHAPGKDNVDVPIEYCILLCTAAPTVRIVGDLNKYGEPVSARIEHQDSHNPFETWVGNCGSVEKILLAYARCFNSNKGVNRRRWLLLAIRTMGRPLSGFLRCPLRPC